MLQIRPRLLPTVCFSICSLIFCHSVLFILQLLKLLEKSAFSKSLLSSQYDKILSCPTPQTSFVPRIPKLFRTPHPKILSYSTSQNSFVPHIPKFSRTPHPKILSYPTSPTRQTAPAPAVAIFPHLPTCDHIQQDILFLTHRMLSSYQTLFTV